SPTIVLAAPQRDPAAVSIVNNNLQAVQAYLIGNAAQGQAQALKNVFQVQRQPDRILGLRQLHIVQIEAGDGVFHHFGKQIVERYRVVKRFERLTRRTQLVGQRPVVLARRGQPVGQCFLPDRRRLDRRRSLSPNRPGRPCQTDEGDE